MDGEVVYHSLPLFWIGLSDDIKGERLRFIEAMKEATAINIQSKTSLRVLIPRIRKLKTTDSRNPDHVEEFKKQLTREVMIMTGEVGKLQKERQALEQQIGDLFTFYAKQKSLTAGLVWYRLVPQFYATDGFALLIAHHVRATWYPRFSASPKRMILRLTLRLDITRALQVQSVVRQYSIIHCYKGNAGNRLLAVSRGEQP